MTESNPTQVILTDDGLKIIKASNAAATANNGVNDINSDNKLTPSEKISLRRLYDTDVLKHDFDVKQLTSMSLPTTDIDLALSNLTTFTAHYFANMSITETVDRQALNKVFNDFENADKAVEGLFNGAVQQVADDAKKAGDDAKEVGEKAQEAGEAAKQAADQAQTDATQAKSDAATAQQKAQSSIDQLNTHLPDIDEALSTANLVKQNITKLSDTTEQYHNEYTTGIQNVVKTIDDITVGGTNLLKNSKFDDKMNNWRIWCPQGMGTSTVEIDPTGGGGDWPRQAIYSAKIVNTEADKNNQFGIAQDNIPVEPNAEYTFQLFNDGANPITVQHGNGSNDPFVSQVVSDHKAVWKFKTPADIYNTNIYIGFNSGQSGTAWVSLTKLEKGNKPTDWSLSPFDTATSTEIDQINNAIKLKADSSDVTSQINVAIQGVQTDVTNKVSGLNTKISQTSDAVQILADTSGIRNLVYNATFEQMTNGFPTGWTKDSNTSNETGYVSNVPSSSYQGRNSIGVNTSKEMGWVMLAQSDPQPLPVNNSTDSANNIYSASMMVKVFGDWGAKPNGRVDVVLAFFDANKKRIDSNIKTAWSQTATDSKEQWQLVKVENLAPVASAQYVGIQAFTYGVPTHAMINQPMINIGATVQPFKPDMVNQASITASINNINLKVSNADGTSSQVNINNDTILLDANKIIFNGNTSIQNGTIGTAKIANAAINTAQIADGAINNAKIANAAINDAKISNLNGNKIIAGSITSQQLNANDIIANVINGKTINGITINTPTLDLGLNGTLTTDFNISQDTSLYAPKKGTGTLTIKTGVINSSSKNMSRYSSTEAYWYGFDDNGNMVKNGTNQTGDDYAPGYEKHDIMKSNGNVLNRSYLDAMGLMFTEGGTTTYNTMLTGVGLETATALLHKDLATNGTFNAALGTKNTYGFSIGSQVVAPMIRTNSYTYAANMFISSYGTMGVSTSTKANKLDIVDVPNMLQKGYNLLTINPRQWFDKTSVEAYADVQSGNLDSIESVVNIKPVTGMVAEEVASAGLDDYVVKDENNKVQGLAYDRLWTLLLPVLRDMNDKINKLQKKEGI